MSIKNEPKITVLREVEHEVQGTTKLDIYDGGYNQTGTDLEFRGHISAAPLGLLQVQEVKVEWDDGLTYNEFRVNVYQASKREMLDVYKAGRYFGGQMKKHYGLNCETASFDIETKFGCDHFYTGADGYFADLSVYKQYYGMSLGFSFDEDLHTFEDLETRFLQLFKPRKVAA